MPLLYDTSCLPWCISNLMLPISTLGKPNPKSTIKYSCNCKHAKCSGTWVLLSLIASVVLRILNLRLPLQYWHAVCMNSRVIGYKHRNIPCRLRSLLHEYSSAACVHSDSDWSSMSMKCIQKEPVAAERVVAGDWFWHPESLSLLYYAWPSVAIRLSITRIWSKIPMIRLRHSTWSMNEFIWCKWLDNVLHMTILVVTTSNEACASCVIIIRSLL